MVRAIVPFFVALVSVYPSAGTSCLDGQCNDETSLMQVKASVQANRTDPDDLKAGFEKRLSNAKFPEDLKAFRDSQRDHTRFEADANFDAGFDAGERAERTLLTHRTGSLDKTLEKKEPPCLEEKDFEGHGNFPHCRSEDAPTDLPCNACIEDQWATHSAAGFACCDDMAKKGEGANLGKQPLCGICLRAKVSGGLHGPGDKQDQRRFAECAKSYCQLKDLRGKAITTALLQKIASDCSPGGTDNPTTPEEDMVAIVANNPKKGELEAFLQPRGNKIASNAKSITGTASSSKMAWCVTKAKMSGFSTESGPWGGDAQLAGLIAAQCTMGGITATKQYVKAIVFFADEDEAHMEDIQSLKNIMERCFPANKIAFDAGQAVGVVDGL